MNMGNGRELTMKFEQLKRLNEKKSAKFDVFHYIRIFVGCGLSTIQSTIIS
jgi:hypothetical protein